MTSCQQLLQALEHNAYDGQLSILYGKENLLTARSRAIHVTQALLEKYTPVTSVALFSGPGRTEIGGNHTDHQHGRVLCGSVDLDMLACAALNGLQMVRIQSEGYPALEIFLDDLAPKKEEQNTSVVS